MGRRVKRICDNTVLVWYGNVTCTPINYGNDIIILYKGLKLGDLFVGRLGLMLCAVYLCFPAMFEGKLFRLPGGHFFAVL